MMLSIDKRTAVLFFLGATTQGIVSSLVGQIEDFPTITFQILSFFVWLVMSSAVSLRYKNLATFFLGMLGQAILNSIWLFPGYAVRGFVQIVPQVLVACLITIFVAAFDWASKKIQNRTKDGV